MLEKSDNIFRGGHMEKNKRDLMLATILVKFKEGKIRLENAINQVNKLWQE
jgi:hypothetical protein